MRTERTERIYGPYRNRKGWRVVTIRADGARIAATYTSEAKARAVIDDFRAATDTRTVSAAVDEYLADLRAHGQRPTTIATIGYRLKACLRTNERERTLRAMTVGVARELWARRCAEVEGETQHGELATVRRFFVWAMARGWTSRDPFLGCERTKPRRRGKPQLRIDEARRYLATALSEGTDEGLAAAMALLFGVRASEITSRVVRDVDDGARVLWIERAKTRAGDRQLEVPEVLRPRLAALVAGRGGGEPLWRDQARDRHWLYRHVRRICRAAGVPVVPPHGLRGTWTTLARPSTPVDQVARALGHADAGTTAQRHYLAAGAEQAARQATALRVLAGGQR